MKTQIFCILIVIAAFFTLYYGWKYLNNDANFKKERVKL